MNFNHWFKYHFPFIFLLIAIFVQSSFPSVQIPEHNIIDYDKLVHIGLYGLLATLCYISIIHQNKFTTLYKHPILFTILICGIYGITDEIHQSLVPHREGEIFDWFADITGIFIGATLIKYYLSKRFAIFMEK